MGNQKDKNNNQFFLNYKNELDSQKDKINDKIRNIESKLIVLNNKESIINTIINKLNIELENIDPKHFKTVGQLRTTLNKQLESLSLIIDMIVKLEDMIQKYRKMIIDIENQKINNFIKLQKEEQEIEGDISKILLQINNQFNEMKNTNPEMLNMASEELKELGYIK